MDAMLPALQRLGEGHADSFGSVNSVGALLHNMFSGKPFAFLWILAILALSLRVYSENLTLPKYMVQPLLFDRRVYIIILPFNDRPVIGKVIDDIVDAFGVSHQVRS